MKTARVLIRFTAILVALVLVGYVGFFIFFYYGSQRRDIDLTPVESILDTSLQPGQAEAEFDLDTSGDQGHIPRVQVGFQVVVRYGNKELRQTIASCDHAGFGDPIIDGATCDDDDYWLLSDNGKVIVEIRNGNSHKIVTQIPLPAGIDRAVLH